MPKTASSCQMISCWGRTFFNSSILVLVISLLFCCCVSGSPIANVLLSSHHSSTKLCNQNTLYECACSNCWKQLATQNITDNHLSWVNIELISCPNSQEINNFDDTIIRKQISSWINEECATSIDCKKYGITKALTTENILIGGTIECGPIGGNLRINGITKGVKLNKESQIALDALVQILQSREHLLSYVIGIDLMGVSTTNNQGWSNYLDTGSSYPLLDTERVDTKKMKDTEEDYEEDDYSDEDDESSIVIESGSSKIPKQDHIDPTNNTNNPSNSSKTVGKLVPDLLRTDLSPINSTSIMIIKVNNTKEVENNDSPSVLLMGSVDSSTQQTNTDLNPLPQSKDQEKIANINATPKSSDGYLTDLMGNIPNWITIFVLSLLCTFFISLFVVAIVTLVIVKCRANWKKIGSTSKQMEKEPVKSIIKPSIDEELEKNDREDNDGNVVSNQKKANCPGIRLKSNAYGVEDKLLVENESTTKV